MRVMREYCGERSREKGRRRREIVCERNRASIDNIEARGLENESNENRVDGLEKQRKVERERYGQAVREKNEEKIP